MPISREDLDAVVRDGLASDIFRAERAIALLETSGKRADQINSGAGNFGELFGAIQGALTTEATLAIARLFDKPSKHLPTASIKGVLAYLASQHDELPSIGQAHQLELSLKAMKAPAKILALVREQPSMFAPEFAEFMTRTLNRDGRPDALRLLKALRDKSLAHNEHVADLEGPSWNALIDLTDLAKQIVGVIGWAYLSTAYTPNGEYWLTEDAKRPSLALDRLLDVLYVQPPIA